MTNQDIATSAEQPINRHAAVAAERISAGTLVGVDNSGRLVKADQAGGQPAMGIAIAPAFPSGVNNTAPEDVKNLMGRVQSERATVGEDRIAYVTGGVEVELADSEMTTLTPGAPVYLGDGGNVSTSQGANLTQPIGYALTEDRWVANFAPEQI